jgi:hypothetical protein
MGATPKELEFDLDGPCRFCRKMGGGNPPCEDCIVIAVVKVKDK